MTGTPLKRKSTVSVAQPAFPSTLDPPSRQALEARFETFIDIIRSEPTTYPLWQDYIDGYQSGELFDEFVVGLQPALIPRLVASKPPSQKQWLSLRLETVPRGSARVGIYGILQYDDDGASTSMLYIGQASGEYGSADRAGIDARLSLHNRAFGSSKSEGGPIHRAAKQKAEYERQYSTLWSVVVDFETISNERLTGSRMLCCIFEHLLQLWLGAKSAMVKSLARVLAPHPFWKLGSFDWNGVNSNNPLTEEIPDQALKNAYAESTKRHKHVRHKQDCLDRNSERVLTRQLDPAADAAHKAKQKEINRRVLAKQDQDGSKRAKQDRKNAARNAQHRLDMAEAQKRGVPKQTIVDERKADRKAKTAATAQSALDRRAIIERQRRLLDRQTSSDTLSPPPTIATHPFASSVLATVVSGSGAPSKAPPSDASVARLIPSRRRRVVLSPSPSPPVDVVEQLRPAYAPTRLRPRRERPQYVFGGLQLGEDDDDDYAQSSFFETAETSSEQDAPYVCEDGSERADQSSESGDESDAEEQRGMAEQGDNGEESDGSDWFEVLN